MFDKSEEKIREIVSKSSMRTKAFLGIHKATISFFLLGLIIGFCALVPEIIAILNFGNMYYNAGQAISGNPYSTLFVYHWTVENTWALTITHYTAIAQNAVSAYISGSIPIIPFVLSLSNAMIVEALCIIGGAFLIYLSFQIGQPDLSIVGFIIALIGLMIMMGAGCFDLKIMLMVILSIYLIVLGQKRHDRRLTMLGLGLVIAPLITYALYSYATTLIITKVVQMDAIQSLIAGTQNALTIWWLMCLF